MNGFRKIQRPFLLPLSPVYWIAVSVRNLLFDLKLLKSKTFDLPVISVGNITAGGTGKTPHVEMLIRMLRQQYRLAVLREVIKGNRTALFLQENNPWFPKSVMNRFRSGKNSRMSLWQWTQTASMEFHN